MITRLLRTALACLWMLACCAHAAFATDFVVTKTADTNDGVCNGDCSLREAIVAANAAAGADRVILGNSQTYLLATGRLTIADAVTIEGHGSTIDGSGLDRVMDIQGAFAATLNMLTIQGGAASGFLSLGGGINIRGAFVTLNSSFVTSNSTTVEGGSRDDGGGIAVIGSYNATTGLTSLASLTLNDSGVSNNTGLDGGGIECVLCTLTIARSLISTNHATGGDGGGIDMVGDSSTASITGSTIMTNDSTAGASRGGGLSVPFGASSSSMSLNRIVSNAATTGSAIFSGAASINAANNWWGCNYGPGGVGPGCSGTPNTVDGAIASSPFLLLTATTSPGLVAPAGSSTTTGSLTINSASTDTSAGGNVLNGTTVLFSATLGSFPSPSVGTSGGKATNVFTAGSMSGNASINLTVDGQVVAISLTINNGRTPTISGIGNTSTYRTKPVTVGITVGSLSGLVGSVSLSGSSSNNALLPNGNMVFGGFGASRTLTMTPATGNIGTATVTVVANDGGFTASTSFVLLVNGSAAGDFDGDGRSDITVNRPSTGAWYSLPSAANFAVSAFTTQGWGTGSDVTVPADYDGDGKNDYAVFRPSTSQWLVLKSSTNFTTSVTYVFGVSTDTPVPGDYDGDGKADIAIYRPSTGQWFILRSTSNYTAYSAYAWGLSGDVPMQGDSDGDGRTDITAYRPSTGQWFALLSSSNFSSFTVVTWGGSADRPVPGDYDGDGRFDPAVYRPSTFRWFILLSGSNYTTSAMISWGGPSDTPVPGDYDGDSRIDLAIYRPSAGQWFILQSSSNYTTFDSRPWGASTDIPVNHRP